MADEDTDDDFELEAEEPEDDAPKKGRKAGKKGKTKKSAPEGAQVLSYRHLDKRVNNPEVGMVHPENDPDKPKTKWAYDPHIDPALQFDSCRSRIEKLIDDALASGDKDRMQDALKELRRLQEPYLNWAGKTERTSFEIDTVSLHVHERIDPASILSAIRKRMKNEKEGGEKAFQPGLFDAPFENLPLRQALDFYKHEKNWSNRLIAGDSLLVMNSLLNKESMAGQVQMIYFDPPYGIKYGSNFQPFTNKRSVKDGADSDLTQEPEMIKAFRDTWELGIHSYLTYLRDRLLLAKELLHQSGSIFLQISDENVHHVREVLDEVLKKENFVAQIVFRKKSMPLGSTYLEGMDDLILWYARDKEKLKYRQLYREQDVQGLYYWPLVELPNGERRRMSSEEAESHSQLPAGSSVARQVSIKPPTFSEASVFPIHLNGQRYLPGDGCWIGSSENIERLKNANRLQATGSTVNYFYKIDDFPFAKITANWPDMGTGNFTDTKIYVVQTTAKALERCLLMTTDPGDLVLDPTCGSGTTAFAAEKWGRRWITCDTSRVAVTLSKQRLMTASYDYYSLRFPHEGLKGGFSYQVVPHITLKSIANNLEIDAIFESRNGAVVAALADLNSELVSAETFYPSLGFRKKKPVSFAKGERLEKWEVPFEWPTDNDGKSIWPLEAREKFDVFHKVRQAMQAAIDSSIKNHAEPETLYDKPEIDKSRLRVTGPFSVEAVPNPTVVALDDTTSAADASVAVARSGETSRQTTWRDELLRTGIRGKGGHILQLTELETVPGLKHIHASGTFKESGDRVLVSFGPQHAALEQRQVSLALSEAEKLRPAPKFIVFCAFTFDPEAAKDIDEVNWPGVTLLKAQMNTDLLTEDLKKARSSNQSFWLMGQPDVDVRKREDGKWEVEVNGFDYFDPKAGELVSGGKSKIAMWSLDIDYDQRSLFPHQVFFPMAGAKDGWNKLKKSIKAELDEDLLEQFHGTVSLPFAAGDNKRVAVKIVDDRGIESLKIVALDD